MKNRLRIILLGITAILFANSFISVSTAQKRLGTFSHNTPAHKTGKYKDCAACHTLPTKNWMSPRRDKQAPFPDVATFPSHTSCFGCHTRDIYSNGGAFCGTCHVVPTMRARAVLAFPIRSHATQFTTLFPHNVHQDIIASNRNNTDYAVAHFIPAVFSIPDDKPKPTFYNCAICHASASQTPKYEPRKLSLLKPLADIVPDTFEKPVTAEFFKSAPDSHASCFTCHYQYQNLPVNKNNCSGCHEMTRPYFDKNVIGRYSMKFDHQRDGHMADCTTCHVRITQNGDVRTMKDADVPILSCKQCHATQEDTPFRKILITEIENREASIAKKQPVFQCSYCHTSAIGRYDIPVSHRKQ
jgi:hypothetical protein